MNYRINLLLLGVLALTGALQGCHKKLELFPSDRVTSEVVFKTPAGYRQVIAKVYASMAVTGTNGRDIPEQIVSDEGNTGFLRQFWYLQCLSTDEAGWTYSGNTDPVGIHQMSWSASTQAIAGSYYRSLYVITQANNFIREAADDKLTARGITGADAENIRAYKAEARFLRAFNYWVLMDLFGNPPFIDENLIIGGGILPTQIKRKDLFNYIETELKALETVLANPRTNENGRADRAAAWALLARMYLNAEVYTGTQRNTDAITYAKKVIDAGYTLHNNYRELMLGDNHTLTNEFIWTIRFDGQNTQTYSGTTFLVHGPAAAASVSQQFKDTTGTNGTWDCIRITEQFVNKFDQQDIRGQFWTAGQSKNMDTLLGAPRSGYSSVKFRNRTRTGALPATADPQGNHVDIDMPMFRLAEMFLIYAEAVVRGGAGGDQNTGLGYLRQLAIRARPNDLSAASYPQMTLNYLIDERGRELMWEGHRRTDLIRFNQFTTGAYLWAWKGGVRSGTAVDSKYNLYPIPGTELSSNTNLVQNTGY